MHPQRLVARGRGLKAILLLCPLVALSSFAGYTLYAINDLYSYTYHLTVNYDELYPVASINTTVLHDMALVYEDRLDRYHVPLNLTIMTWFNPGGSVNRYDATENAALWNGKAAAAAAMHYWLAPNGTTEKEDARRLVHKLATGLGLQIAVPNGGLGPGYTNTVARFYVPPWTKADGNYTWMFDQGDMNFNGTGPFKDWRCKLTTSKDELGGYFLGIAALQRFVTDDPYIVNLTRLITGQLIEGFIQTNWQELDGDGLPNGVNLNPMLAITSEWKLLVTRLAANAYPGIPRYQQLYNQFAVDDYGLVATPRLDPLGCISAYYGYGFVHDLILGLVLAETNQAFLDRFISNYEQENYPIFAGHRNAYFNAIFLSMNAMRSTPTGTYNLTLIRHDVLDQLWRFNMSGWCPMDDSYGGKDRAFSRADLDPLGQNWTIVNPAFSRWTDFALLNAIMPLSTHYMKPLAADMMGCSDFIWGDDPFDNAGGRGRDTPSLIHESPGTSFTLPYYLLRVFGYI